MKSKWPVILVLSFAIGFTASAQKNETRFHSINTFGLAGGASKTSTAFQSVNGIQFSKWFSGVGVGVDYYHYKTLPLFIDGRWFFGEDKNGFIYGDLGYHFTMKNKPGKEIRYYDTYHFTGGIYTDIGIGYQVPLYKGSAVLFSLGHSYKKMGTKIGVRICPFIGPCYVDYSKYDFSFNRMILKAGLLF